MREKTLLIDRVDRAKNDVANAESELDRLMGELDALPRAQKTTVSSALDTAFSKLRDARSYLAELERVIASVKPDDD
jgi:hypothetical protein